MALTSMPLVFSKEVKHHDPEDWYSEIRKYGQDYESLRIASLTRVKDLDSDWAHEYVEFIVQRQLPIGRARVYAERGVPKISIDKVPPAMSVNTSTFLSQQISVNPFTFGRGAVDGVTIGVNECDKEGRWRGLPHDLPLSLMYFVYADKKPSFISLAKTISEKDAKEFDDLRRSGFVMAELPLSRERTSPVEHITTLKNLVLDPNTIDRYLKILHENSISADQPTVELYLENESEKAKKQEGTQGELRWTEAFDENVRELEKNIVRQMSDKEKNDMYEKIEQVVLHSGGKLSMYRQCECMSLQKDDLQAPDSSGITSKQLGLNEPQARQYYLVEELLDRFAATVVAAMENDLD
ncbi:hypothetical protein AAWM_06217 [Aspergillus awamori]|uniref:Uncharacterized protein n=1 Tax=Aspergillus awamori TaxID=105351 RepID=A0A401KVN7_ASPAW|nr:hypothetical protein AAWM_06217 [Aspergillus awamori]